MLEETKCCVEGCFFVVCRNGMKAKYKISYIKRHDLDIGGKFLTVKFAGGEEYNHLFKTKEALIKAEKLLSDAIELHEKMKLLDGFVLAILPECNIHECFGYVDMLLKERQKAKEQLEKEQIYAREVEQIRRALQKGHSREQKEVKA